jgi:poly-beta-1,6-N-acetyl-D-glucosamine synthase
VTIHLVQAVAFWAALALLVYVYVGYPFIAWCRARMSPRWHKREPIAPLVTVVVVAHNEAATIGGRIQNLLALDYPAERLDIVIASDGSTDATVARARLWVDARVVVRTFERRRGKAAVLNDVVPSARGEIVVLADARQRFEPAAVKALVSNFADHSVGAASGELMLQAGTTATGEGAGFYWRYEKFMRRHESRTDSTVGATGAIYAIRRPLFEPIPDSTILDDVLVPMRVMRRGYRVVFDPQARAVDGAAETPPQEFVRKTRTIAGIFQLFCRERWLLNPFRNRIWFETWSHKALRLAAPLLQAAVLACSFALHEALFYRLMFLGQCVFYAAAIGGLMSDRLRTASPKRGIPSPESRAPSYLRILAVPHAICLLNWTTIVGFVRYVTGNQHATWERATPVSVPALPPPMLRSSRS